MLTSVVYQLTVLTALMSLLSCGGSNTSSNVKSPGQAETAKTTVLEAGADLLQTKTPISKLNMYLDGFHFYNGDMKGQMEAHHFCSVVNEDVTQCIIYDGNTDKAKIMGVEYIISKRLFKDLPSEEKKLWHSHVYEVKSGQLIAPGIPDVVEHELMKKLVSTYGKTFHTWHTDQKFALPMGHPMIMMGFTKDGQANPAMVNNRNKRFNVSPEAKKKNRADIVAPPIDEGADAWQEGEVRQLKLTEGGEPAHNHRALTQ